MKKFFQRYALPGLIFQSVVIGGGYGTGRELAEFFMPHGPVGGLLAMSVATLIWGVVLAVSFEFARVTGSYDYRTFFCNLLGPFWVVFEFSFLLFMVIVLSVIGAAAGELAHGAWGIPKFIGSGAFLITVILLVFYGSTVIAGFLSTWSILLYAVYFIFLVTALANVGESPFANFTTEKVGSGWVWDGIRYAGYNISVVPVVLFAIRAIETRTEALTSGFLAGVIAILPAAFFFIAMTSYYPEINEAPIPATFILNALGIVWLTVVFQVMLLGTFVETGTGLIHSVNERIAENFRERGAQMSRFVRPAVAFCMLAIASALAMSVGLIDLIAKGYGILTYVFIAIYLIPLLTVGVWKIWRTGNVTQN